MKKGKILQLVGLILVLCSLSILGFGLMHNRITGQKNQQIAARLQALMPPRTPGFQEQRTELSMPALSLDGKDYIALLEVPAFGVSLPVRSTWGSLESQNCPSRFCGTVYDGSLVIGGSGKAGHLDFVSRIGLGDTVKVAAMDGTEFTYRVTEICRSKRASQTVLLNENAHLTLFAWNPNTLEYIIVRCAT